MKLENYIKKISSFIAGVAVYMMVAAFYLGAKGFGFDENNNIVFCGNRIHLSKNEYDILSLLDKKRSEPVSREEINRVLGGECGNMCDVYICRIRRKLSAFRNEKLIYTVRNRGYMLKLK